MSGLFSIIPFLYEMIVGKTPVEQAIKRKRKNLFIFCLLCISIGFNFYTFKKVGEWKHGFESLKREYSRVLSDNKTISDTNKRLYEINISLYQHMKAANPVALGEMTEEILQIDKEVIAVDAQTVTNDSKRTAEYN